MATSYVFSAHFRRHTNANTRRGVVLCPGWSPILSLGAVCPVSTPAECAEKKHFYVIAWFGDHWPWKPEFPCPTTEAPYFLSFSIRYPIVSCSRDLRAGRCKNSLTRIALMATKEAPPSIFCSACTFPFRHGGTPLSDRPGEKMSQVAGIPLPVRVPGHRAAESPRAQDGAPDIPGIVGTQRIQTPFRMSLGCPSRARWTRPPLKCNEGRGVLSRTLRRPPPGRNGSPWPHSPSGTGNTSPATTNSI